jgi:hypothetical protein
MTHSLPSVALREVLRQVKEAGSRFLKKSDYKADIWEEVSDEIAREKVCQVSLLLRVTVHHVSIVSPITN